MAVKYSEELEEKIIKFYEQNISPYQMVKMIPELSGKRPSVIYGILKRKGIESHKKCPLTDEQRYPERNVDNYSLTIGGNKQLERILDELYGNATIFLDRKYNRYIEFKQQAVVHGQGLQEAMND